MDIPNKINPIQGQKSTWQSVMLEFLNALSLAQM